MPFALRCLAAAFIAFALCIGAETAKSATVNTLYSFHDFYGTFPNSGMIKANGVLYGTTQYGGSGRCNSDFGTGCGVVFSFNLTTKEEKVLHNFKGGNRGGAAPLGHLIYSNGMLYGTTYAGGGGDCADNGYAGCGTVFSIDPAGVVKVIYAFKADANDGTHPIAALIPITIEKKLKLVGTTYYGGTGGTCQNLSTGCGTIFEIDVATGAEVILHSFRDDGSDGIWPSSDLRRIKSKIFGTTVRGGKYGYGTIFSFDIDKSNESVAHSFGKDNDGCYPNAGVTQIDNLLFGTTVGCGGRGYIGTIFSINSETGLYNVLYSFSKRNQDAIEPVSDLIKYKGILYGTTLGGGHHQDGAVFSFDPKTAVETVIYSNDIFQDPFSRLTIMEDAFVGTSYKGGDYGQGTIFSIVP